MIDSIKSILKDSISVKQTVLNNTVLLENIEKITNTIIQAYKNGNKVLLCGNGGSAADAQHIAAELSNKLYKNRAPLDAEALHVNTSYLTAAANDFSFKEVYARQVLSKGKKDDVLIALSTSGKSENIIEALKIAKQNNLVTVGFSGNDGGNMKALCDYILIVPSANVARIQECHITIGHIICEIIEEKLF